MTVRYILQLLCLIIAASQAATQITKGPRHTGVKQGDEETLECRATIPAGDTLVWAIHEDDGTGERIYLSGDGILKEGYDIAEGPNQYNLVITAATKGQAELYACRILTLDEIEEAELVVLDPVTCSSATQTVEIGDEMIFPCSVTFDGGITPRLQLKLDNTILHETVVDVDKTLSFRYNTSANAGHDEKEFICEVSFASTGGTEPAEPVYTDKCSRQVLVNHPPQDLEIIPDPENYPDNVIPRALGENITCTASGRPEPDIFFSKGNTTEHDVVGSVMVIGPEHIGRHKYKCNAQNNAGNRVNIESKSFSIDVSAGPGGSTGGQSGLTSHDVSRVMAHVIVVVFSFLLHTYS